MKRKVYIIRYYIELTPSGKGRGLIKSVLYDFETDQEIKTMKRCCGLRRHAQRNNWELVKKI